MRILAVDAGTKRLGIAVSDLTGTVANPLEVIEHDSRSTDAQTIVRLADENEADLIIVGQAMGSDGTPSPRGRSAARLAGAIRHNTHILVELWDESGSTQAARSAKIKMGSTRKRRSGHLDEFAATVILQSYIEAHLNEQSLQVKDE